MQTVPSCRQKSIRIDNNFQGNHGRSSGSSVQGRAQKLTFLFDCRTLQAFRRANINTMLEIEKLDKAELLSNKSEVRHRGASKHQQSNLAFQQDSVTEKMLAISRHLSETTQRSAATLETLVSSSANVEGTRDELQNTAGSISHSNKLLKKYGRRECTDKILVFFAFTLFIAVVLYIVQKRLF